MSLNSLFNLSNTLINITGVTTDEFIDMLGGVSEDGDLIKRPSDKGIGWSIYKSILAIEAKKSVSNC